MTATTLSLHTPWRRALWRSGRIALAGVVAWLRRPQGVPVERLPALDDRMRRDMGLPDWLHHDVAVRRHTRAVERIASGLPPDLWR